MSISEQNVLDETINGWRILPEWGHRYFTYLGFTQQLHRGNNFKTSLQAQLYADKSYPSQ